jgi:DUF4097 and DUF4098 domain-containing protein YvlB
MKMKRILVFVLGGLLVTPVLAEEQVDKTIDAASDGTVEIYNTAGHVTVRGWSRDSVQVSGELGDDVEELVLERDGDYVLVKVKVPRNHGRDIDAEITVNLPQDSSIEVSGVSADIDVEGVNGDQALQTVSGDVEVDGVSADIEAASVSGDVEVIGTGNSGEAAAATVSGDVSISGFAGEVQAESVSGDVTITDGSFERVYFETVNGDLRFAGQLLRGGRVAAESVNGDVDIQFDGDVSASFDIETFNGNIDNCFGPDPERTSRYAPGLELSFTEGDGDGRVVIETLNGGVSICNE